MKKKLFIGLAGIVAIAAAVCVTVTNVNSSSTSDLMIQNIEALTQNEGGATNTGPAQLVACPDGVSIGKYCMATGGSACSDVPCSGNGGYIFVR